MKTLLEAASAYAAGCEVVTGYTRQVNALRSKCEALEPGEWEGVTTCVDRLTAVEEHGDLLGEAQQAVSVPWWQADEKQLDTICAVCRERIGIWRDRYEARKRIAGLKTALIRAYRRELRTTADTERGAGE